MPYIAPDRRPAIDELVDQLPEDLGVGDLNYAITRMVARFVEQEGGLRYTNLNAAVGVLECAKLELYRRVAAPYEDLKVDENGDAYPAELTN